MLDKVEADAKLAEGAEAPSNELIREKAQERLKTVLAAPQGPSREGPATCLSWRARRQTRRQG